MIICPKKASSGINFQQISEDEVHVAIEMTLYWVLTQKLNVWDQTVCSYILQQRLHLFVEWDGAFICHSCESHTTELRKQFIPAEDAFQFLWKKSCFATAVRSVSLISAWKKYSDRWWKFKCTEMRSRPRICAACWILLGKKFCRSEGIFCLYREGVEVLERL